MNRKEYYTVGSVPKYNRIKTEPKSLFLTMHIHDRSLSWLGTATSIKRAISPGL